VEGLLEWGVLLRFAAIGTYAAAFVSYVARLAVQKLKLDRAATALAVLGAARTAYLVTRWIAAGRIEITLGWAGKRPAAIAVFAFAVVVFTFMGVNLGLTGEGLHTYGAG